MAKVSSALTVLLLANACIAGAANSREETWSPKTGDETEILALIIKSEIQANQWTNKDLICFMVDNEYPGRKSVKSLRQLGLNVRSSEKWTKKFDCGFEVRLEFLRLEESKSAEVRASAFDLREINRGEGDLALLLREGVYSVRKIDGRWAVTGFVARDLGDHAQGPPTF